MERRQLHWSLEERIRFGSRFRTRRSERGLDALDLVSAFNLHQKKLSGYLQSLIHPLTEENGRSRISRLENGKLGSIFEDELQLWALTVEWSVEEWLERVPPRGFEWEPDQLAAFGRVLAKHEEEAQHLTGWAGFLPCSLETEEFMQLHNRYLCEHVKSYTPAVKFHGNLDAAVRYYNEFGTRRRTRLHERLVRKTGPKLKQLMYARDLERIAQGKGEEYAAIPWAVRLACLQYLRDFIGEHRGDVTLIIAEHPEPDFDLWSAGKDSIAIIGTSVVFWRTFDLRINFTSDLRDVASYRSLLDCLEEQAKYKDWMGSIAFLNMEIAWMNEHPEGPKTSL